MTQEKTILKSGLEPATLIGKAGEYDIHRINSPLLIKDAWQAIQREGNAHIYQHYDWVRIACDTLESNNTVCIIVGKSSHGVEFILPMAHEGGFIKSLRWIGGSHANICCGLYTERFLKSDNTSVMKNLATIVGKSIGAMSMFKLNNQPFLLNSFKNPLSNLSYQNSVNIMYAMDLTDGLDGVLDAGNGKRKRKLWRKQNRVADTMGGFSFVTPESNDDILEAIREFRDLKAKRFKQMGISDVFADQRVVDFLVQSAIEPADEYGQVFKIIQLKVAGKTRAMYAYGINGDYCQAYVNAVEYDDFADHSPGEMVLYGMVEHLVNQGYAKLDLGVGDERYKRSWCPNRHNLFDSILPLSIYAMPISSAVRIKNRLKRYVRNNPTLWLQLKKVRKIKAAIFSRNQPSFNTVNKAAAYAFSATLDTWSASSGRI